MHNRPAPPLTVIEEAYQLIQAGNLRGAKQLLLQVITDSRDSAQAWFLLGAVYGQTGELDKCISSCRKAVEIQPRHLDAHYNLAQALQQAGRHDEAAMEYTAVLTLDPKHPGALNNLEMIYLGKAHTSKAIAIRRRALAAAPGDPQAHADLAETLRASGQGKHAEQHLLQALRIEPGLQRASNLLGAIYMRRGRPSEAMHQFATSLEFNPGNPEAMIGLAMSCLAQRKHQQATRLLRNTLGAHPENDDARSAYLFSLNYYCQDPGFIFSEHCRLMQRSNPQKHTRPRLTRKKRIRIGYISPDFRNHSIAHFVKPILRNHDRSGFRIYCYAHLKREDPVSTEIRSLADVWRRIDALGSTGAASLIRDDNIDILVDLAGHTTHEIMPILCRKPAPIQITYLGYPNTTGCTAVDFRLTDAQCDPPDSDTQRYTEQQLRLAHGFLCYEPPADAPPVKAHRYGQGSGITFGSFNNLFKVTDEVLQLWARILQEVPGSSLMLKSRYLHDPVVCADIHKAFSRQGISMERVALLGNLPNRREHLAMYNHIDIALDTFPYNGTTTTCEALWMGVPVISLSGSLHASRVGQDLLSRVGLDELAAASPDEYCAAAVQLAADHAALDSLHKTLRARVAASPLRDEPGFTRELEGIYCSLWNNYDLDKGKGGIISP